MTHITYEEFERVDLRSGEVIKVEKFSRAKKPAFKIWVDFGHPIGILQTSAQVTVNYSEESLIGKKVVGCVNLNEKNIAGFVSQFLLVGFSDSENNISLVTTDISVPNGRKMH